MIRKGLLGLGVVAGLFSLPMMAQAGGGGGHGGGGHGGGGTHGGFHGCGHDGFHGCGHGGFCHGTFFFGGYPYFYGYWGLDYPGYYCGYAAPPYVGIAPPYLAERQPVYSAEPGPQPASSPDQADPRVIARIALPKPDAQLWVEGKQMTSTGTARRFVSPPLQPGTYSYTLKARWTEDGREIGQTRTVRVQPGDRITVDFTTQEGE
jgi:uncharacterized protein (TIGR03000 family)